MIKGGVNMVVDWMWRLCNMAFEKERSRIRDEQMDNLRGLLGIMRMDKAVVWGDEGCR